MSEREPSRAATDALAGTRQYSPSTGSPCSTSRRGRLRLSRYSVSGSMPMAWNMVLRDRTDGPGSTSDRPRSGRIRHRLDPAVRRRRRSAPVAFAASDRGRRDRRCSSSASRSSANARIHRRRRTASWRASRDRAGRRSVRTTSGRTPGSDVREASGSCCDAYPTSRPVRPPVRRRSEPAR